ncbi:MAG: hypothetical protein ACRD16_02515 [Thermoanaerobaculia bacterium]
MTILRGALVSILLSICGTVFAGFPSGDVFLPAVGRIAGQGGAQFFTTVWATNLTGVAETFTFEFLRQGQANPTPASFTDTLQPGETKTYENVVETRLGLTNAIGAARVVSSGDILVAERIFNQVPGTDLGDTEGLFFAGVPKSFSISLGKSASIQGLNQGSSENFRYNFALVETGGSSTTVNVQIFDASGTLLGQEAFALLPFEQLQPNVADVVPGFSSTNARLTATVTSGAGSVLLAGAQIANLSQDSSGFEMSFPGSLLAGGDGGSIDVVTSLNGLTGALTLTPGTGISITPSGSTISIAATGGGSTLTLPFSGSTSSGSPGFSVTDTAILGVAAIAGTMPSGVAGVLGTAGAPSFSSAPAAGVRGDSSAGFGVAGTTATSIGVLGRSGAGSGIAEPTAGVWGDSLNSFGVVGTSGTSTGVRGVGLGGIGVFGISASSAGVSGVSGSAPGVSGKTTAGSAGVSGINSSLSADSAGVLGVDGTGSTSITGETSSGVRGESKSHVGVQGLTDSGIAGVLGVSNVSGGATGVAVMGTLAISGTEGELASSHSGHNFGVFTVDDAHVGGALTVVGVKNFVEPHPTDPTKEIRFVSLEGPESGTYFRGTARTVGGFATIEVPESFRDVTDERNITVQLTPTGGLAVLACVRKGLDSIVVQGSSDVEFDYMVNGVRKAYKDFEVVRQNQLFVPEGPDDRRFPLYAPEIQRRLVATGIYNADGTVNIETAARLGWNKRWATTNDVVTKEARPDNP